MCESCDVNVTILVCDAFGTIGDKCLFNNDLKFVKKAVEMGIDINTIQNSNNCNVIMYYIFNNNNKLIDLVKFFIENNGDLNHQNLNGDTVMNLLIILFHEIIFNNCEKIIELCLNNGANIYIKNDAGKNTIDFAKKLFDDRKNEKIYKLVRQNKIEKEHKFVLVYWILTKKCLDDHVVKYIMSYSGEPYCYQCHF